MILLKILILLAVVSGQLLQFTSARVGVTDNTELVFSFMVHRHGDRTPINSVTDYNNFDLKKIEELVQPYGYGQLTEVGLRTAYKLGQFIRRRYDKLIAPKYNHSEIYIRSTDVTRCQMSVLTAMSAVFPPVGHTWNDTIHWVPTPYTTVPIKFDFNEPLFSCPYLRSRINATFNSKNERMEPYSEAISKVSKIIGKDITEHPVWILAVYGVIVSLNGLGYDIGDGVRALLPQIEQAAGVARDIVDGDDRYIAYEAGVLLNEFFTYANKVIAGKNTQTVRVYSAHDDNVFIFQAVSQVFPRQGVPKYGSLFALELRRDIGTGQYFVLPVYLADPKEGVEKYLQVQGCGTSVFCDYDKFYNITSRFLMDERSWRKACGAADDMLVETSDS